MLFSNETTNIDVITPEGQDGLDGNNHGSPEDGSIVENLEYDLVLGSCVCS